MMMIRNPVFGYSTFKPAEVEAITGLSTALLRDWRRRKIIHHTLDKGPNGYSLGAVAELLVLKVLSDHGIGPKTVFGSSGNLAGNVMHFALDEPTAWATPDEWQLWEKDQRGEASILPEGVSKSPLQEVVRNRFGLLEPGRPTIAVADIKKAICAPVATVIDLETLGNTLRTSAGKPLGRLAGWQGVDLQ
jgi:hypothetical protein